MASHSPSNPRSSKPAPSKPVAQARDSAIREYPFFHPSVRSGSNRPRSAFTLVELLVVIVILAMLASLVTVAASRAMTAARNAAIKAEIDMLHMAIMNYKNEYGSFPPCADTTTSYAANGPASRHLSRLFPRCTNPTGTGVNAQFASARPLTPATALIAWLTGYANDPSLPLTGGNRTKLYDYDRSRLDTNQLVYFPSTKRGSPFIYINAAEYGTPWSQPIAYSVGAQNYTIAANIYFAQPANGSYVNSGPFANPETFQILCAGADEVFGNDDDLSNFWPSTRKAFLESLNQ
jgi:prepilin-type N-terminal cleavage/methylation domain-containing protein